jgi:hypothetical protein
VSWKANSVRVPLMRDDRTARSIAAIVKHPAQTAKRWALTAAGNRVKPEDRAHRKGKGNEWAEEAWAMYDQVGELHYSANVQASAVSRLNFGPCRTDEDGQEVNLDDLETLTSTDRQVLDILSALGGDSPDGLAELQRGMALHLFVAGSGWFLGLPPEEFDPATGKRLPWDLEREYALTELVWGVYSDRESQPKDGVYKIRGCEYPAKHVVAIQCYRPHPLDSNFSDSPVRSAMPILRELVGLTMHISASIDSRLAGAGALFVPQSASAMGIAAPEDGEEKMDLVDAFIEAAVTAIKERDAAAAMVPVVVTVPDDCGFAPFHVSFSTPFDAATKDLRDEAIRRLALSLDQPPEVLLGLGSSSHWNAWAIQEDYVKLHVTPVGKLIADVMLRFIVRPAMVQLGTAPELALEYSLDVSADELVERPNRLPEALQLHEAGAINTAALRDAGGYDADDAPEEPPAVDMAVSTALEMLRNAPSLAQDPGLPALVAQLRAVLAGEDATTIEEPAADPSQVEEVEVEQAEEESAEGGAPGNGEPPTPEE